VPSWRPPAERLGHVAFRAVAGVPLGPPGGQHPGARPRRHAREKRLGSAGAPNTVIQYSSLGCSHCADFHNQTLAALKSQYLDKGVATFVYRDFALDRTSLLGAMVARCSGDGRYFTVLDVIYQSQPAWAGASDAWGALQKVLRDAGLAQSLIDACVATAAWKRA